MQTNDDDNERMCTDNEYYGQDDNDDYAENYYNNAKIYTPRSPWSSSHSATTCFQSEKENTDESLIDDDVASESQLICEFRCACHNLLDDECAFNTQQQLQHQQQQQQQQERNRDQEQRLFLPTQLISYQTNVDNGRMGFYDHQNDIIWT